MSTNRCEEAGLAERLQSRCETVRARGLSYNVRRWGESDAPPLVLVHGTQDSSITFQFLVDALEREWSVVAPDLRGHGHSEWTPGRYWLHDFLADLDAVLDALFADRPIPLVGHSLGGNVAGAYAGVRPERVTALVSLDGFGPLVHRLPVDPVKLLRSYLQHPEERRRHRAYKDLAEVAARLMKANARLPASKAHFLAERSTRRQEDGTRVWLFDPDHQTSLPTLHRIEDWAALWSRMDLPVCWISSADKRPEAPVNHPEIFRSRAGMVPRLTHVHVPETGHNLHHDAPKAVAETIERFLAGELLPGLRHGATD